MCAVEPVNVNNSKAGSKTELAQKSEGRNKKGETVGENLDSQTSDPTH